MKQPIKHVKYPKTRTRRLINDVAPTQNNNKKHIRFEGIRYFGIDFAYTFYSYFHEMMNKAKNTMKHITTMMDEPIQDTVNIVYKKNTCVLLLFCYPCYLYNVFCNYFRENDIVFWAPFSISQEKHIGLLNVITMFFDEVTVISFGYGNVMLTNILQKEYKRVKTVVMIEPIMSNIPIAENRIVVNGKMDVVKKIIGNVTCIECETDDIIQNLFLD